MTSLIIPHRITIQGHARVGFLVRARCSCGWYALAASHSRAQMAATNHVSEHEAFPDFSFLSDDPTEGTLQ